MLNHGNVAGETIMEDPFNLLRFVTAQDSGGTYEQAVTEVRSGRKQTHWMWFVFPQVAGLGRSPAAQRYAISSIEEAREYLRHPVLGPRLTGIAETAAAVESRDVRLIFGDVDARKLQSSMTLFLRAEPGESVFQRVLDKYFGGLADSATDRQLVRLSNPARSY